MSVGRHNIGSTQDGSTGRPWYALLVELTLHPQRSGCAKLHVSTFLVLFIRTIPASFDTMHVRQY